LEWVVTVNRTTYLIVNADDYGRTPGVSQGIREAHLRGIVSSATTMMNMPGVEAELERAVKEAPKLGLGVHLVLTSGAPLLPAEKVSSITGGGKWFPGAAEFTANLKKVDPDQAVAEWDAQIQKFLKIMGRNPDHLDSHHHSTYFSEALFGKMLDLAVKYRCPIRTLSGPSPATYSGLPEELSDSAWDYIPRLTQRFKPVMPDRFIGTFYDETANTEQLLNILESLVEGTSELMCHPGYADALLMEGSVYNKQRERELSVLTSEPVRKVIQRRGIQLITFGDLSAMGKK
jgi:chitin disaccharide deacetylase